MSAIHAAYVSLCDGRIPSHFDRLCDCGEVIKAGRAGRFCTKCGLAHRLYAALGSGGLEAQTAVIAAVRAKTILPAALFDCADCGDPATAYDHRDYNKPLDVVAVCHGCNGARLSGKPIAWTFEEFLENAAKRKKKGRVLAECGEDVLSRIKTMFFSGPDGRAVNPLRQAVTKKPKYTGKGMAKKVFVPLEVAPHQGSGLT